MSSSPADSGMQEATLGVPAAWWARLGHDLRGAVSPMRLAVQVLRSERCGAAERDEALKLLDRQVDKLLGEIDAAAELMRLRVGSWVFRAHRGDLNLVLDTVSGRAGLARQFAERGQSLLIRESSRAIDVEHDAGHIGAILEFLLQKLSDHSPRGAQFRLGVHDDGSTAWFQLDGVGAAVFDDVELAWLLASEGVDPMQVSVLPVLLREIANQHGLRLQALPSETRLMLGVSNAIDPDKSGIP